MRDTSDLIGRIFDSRYQITALVGRGGMGTVYKAVHVAMNQTVALKVLHREMSQDERQVQRFYQEARASSRLKHPNTIKVFDFGRSDEGHLYLAMEFLEGETLTQVLRREGALPVRRALSVVRQVVKSLAEAHAQGLVHRDLKPDNIFITKIYGEEDFVKVLDFGIAKFTQGNPEYGALTQAGLVCGTPLYLSPEQALGRILDGRSDLYSLGVILYEMLDGHPPFRAETPVALVMRHIHDAPPPLQDRSGGIPEPVRALVFALLDKDRNRRPASAEVLIRLLDDVMTGLPAPDRSRLVPQPASAPAKVETVPTRVEAPLGRSDDDLEGVTQALPFTPPPVPSSPVAPDAPMPERGDALRPVVAPEAPTLYLSRSSSGLVSGRGRTGAPVEEDEETVVVSRSDSSPGRPLVAPGPSSSPRPSVVRKVVSQGPDDSTKIDPPSRIPPPVPRPRRAHVGGLTSILVVLLVVAAAGAVGVGVAFLIQGRDGGRPGPSDPLARAASTAGAEGSARTESPPAAASAEPRPIPHAESAGPPAARLEPAPPRPTEPPPARQASVTFETVPEGASVWMDDRKMGATPLVLTVREGDVPLTLRFVAEGFQETRMTIDPSEVVRSGRTRQRLVLERVVAAPVDRGPAARKVPARPGPGARPEPSPPPAAPRKKKPAPALQWE